LLVEQRLSLPLWQQSEGGVVPQQWRAEPDAGDHEAVDGGEQGAAQLRQRLLEPLLCARRGDVETAEVRAGRCDFAQASSDALTQLVSHVPRERDARDAPQRLALSDE